MRVRRLFIAGFCVAVLCSVFAGSAQACSCVELKPRAAMRQADAVVVGQLIEVIPRGEFTSELRYEVRRAYKGGHATASGRTISVLSASIGSACGLPTQLGRHYGLFLTREGDGWRGSSCASLAPRRLAAAMNDRGHGGRGSTPGCAS